MNKAIKLVNLIFRAVGLTMGVAVTVLTIMNKVPADNAILMLGLGVACLGISTFTAKKIDNDEN